MLIARPYSSGTNPVTKMNVHSPKLSTFRAWPYAFIVCSHHVDDTAAGHLYQPTNIDIWLYQRTDNDGQ